MAIGTIETSKFGGQELLDAALKLPNETKQVFAEVLWESIDFSVIPVSDEEKTMLREARAELDESPDAGIPIDSVLAEIRAMYL